MDEQEREWEDLNLEDILKEYSDEDMKVIPEDTEDILSWDTMVSEQSRPASAVPSDTVRLDAITKAVRDQEAVTEETVRFSLPETEDEESEEPMILMPEDSGVEPYSEAWEPEYEQPIGEYIPPEPIVFRPKNRLQELKRKLVAGPEKRYYELTEQGLGKLQLAILLNFVIALLAAGSTALYALELVPESRLRLLIFWQCLAVLLSGLLGSYQLMGGLSDLFRGRFTLNTLLIFSFAACLVDGVLCLGQLRVPCSAVFSLNMTMSLWSEYQKRNTEMGMMDTMRKAVRLDSVVSVPDYYEGRPGFLRGEGQVEDFMDHYDAPSGPEKVLGVYALAALIVSVGSGMAAGLLHSFEMGLQVFTASLLVAVPATAYISQSRPMAILERRLHKLGTVLCGWQGIKGLSAKGVFPLTDTDLFPAGSAKMNGVKFYGTRNPDEVVAYATAVIVADGGGMAPLFSQLLDSRNGYHYDVSELRNYGTGGVGGVVNGEPVLVGTLSFMREMGVEMPEGTLVNQAVYVAVDGSLCGVFAITYSKVKSSAMGLGTLCSYWSLQSVLVTGDFMLTEEFIRGKFGVNTRHIAFPERSVRAELSQREAGQEDIALALMTRDGLDSAAYAVTGARNLRSAGIAGVVVHMIGGIAGLLIMLALAIVGGDYLISSTNILLYELIWMIPGLLITEWTRSV